MTRVGVVGLGNIGGGLARNLVADGHEVTVTDLDAAKADAIVGAKAVPSVAPLPVIPVSQRLQQLDDMRANGAISDAEYAAKRQEIISTI